MSTSTAAPVVNIPRHALRVVLFGMPDAGKSSLLGALAQAAQVQESSLGVKLTDKSQGLVELQRRLYEDRPRQTLEEIAPYPIMVEPLSGKNANAQPTIEAVLFDCDGRVASELLTHKDSLTGEGDLSKRRLAQAVLKADALVLAIDASGDLAHLKRDFGQFARFLRTLERGRGQRIEVAGLPVYLVLTKCDLLAKPGDTAAAWKERIEEHKRQVAQRFQEFLAQQAEREQMAFGKIDLRVWATAVRRPGLADVGARPKEPFGVAELFRQCLDAASAFRERRRTSTERLGWTLALTGILIGFLTLLALFFLATSTESDQMRLESDLKSYRSAHGEYAAERLRPPLSKTIKELQSFQDNPLFEKMPPEMQKYVEDHLREAQAYQAYAQQFDNSVKADRLPDSPRRARNDVELAAFRQVMEQNPLPEKYRTAWEDTDIARRQRLWKDEIEIMESEVTAALKTFAELEDLVMKITELANRAKYTGTQLDMFLDELRHKDKTLLYRTDNHAQIRKSRVTYNDVAQFSPVTLASDRYQQTLKDRKINVGK